MPVLRATLLGGIYLFAGATFVSVFIFTAAWVTVLLFAFFCLDSWTYWECERYIERQARQNQKRTR